MMEVVVTTEAIRNAKLQSKSSVVTTNKPTPSLHYIHNIKREITMCVYVLVRTVVNMLVPYNVLAILYHHVV